MEDSRSLQRQEQGDCGGGQQRNGSVRSTGKLMKDPGLVSFS
jgi:hypothetical protein